MFLAFVTAAGLAWTTAAQEERSDSPKTPQTVRLLKTITVSDIPENGRSGSNFRDAECCFSADGVFRCVNPLKTGGELCTWVPPDGKVKREAIPQPAGFRGEFDFNHYFDSPALWVNPAADVLIRWQLEGNGDHGLALRKKGSPSFVTTRVKDYLTNSRAVSASNGNWFLLVWDATVPQGFELSVYTLDKELRMTVVGKHRGSGHHSIGVLDAAFSKENTLHIVWADVEPKDNWLRLRSIDLDVGKKSWSKEQDIFRLDRFVSTVTPAVQVLKDGSVHYFWKIDEGQKKTAASGLYYQPRNQDKAVKLSTSYHGFKTLVVGEKIVVSYTLEKEPEKVYSRVIQQGKPGPESFLTLTKRPLDCLWGENFILGVGSDGKCWFVNTLDLRTMYQLRISDVK